MNNRTLAPLLMLVMGLVTYSMLRAQPLSGPPQFDPYLPGELNERALYALKDQDVSTAVILLERAYRLNPHSPDIKANLELVRKINQDKLAIQVNGDVISLGALENVASSEKMLDVPALWPESQAQSKP